MKIVVVTACPSGISHTYLVAESLEKHEKAKGIKFKNISKRFVRNPDEVLQKVQDYVNSHI